MIASGMMTGNVLLLNVGRNAPIDSLAYGSVLPMYRFHYQSVRYLAHDVLMSAYSPVEDGVDA